MKFSCCTCRCSAKPITIHKTVVSLLMFLNEAVPQCILDDLTAFYLPATRIMEQNKETQILELIDTMTATGSKTLDEDKMKNLKLLLTKNKDLMNYAYYALMTQLRKEHSEIRYSALLIVHELFIRSKHFRKLLEKDLDEFFELVVETNVDNPLPKPLLRAKDLKIKALALIQVWVSTFGAQHNALQSGLQYLKNCKRVDFNDMEARSVAQRQQLQREQERQERVLNEKVQKVRSEMKEMTAEIQNTVVQMENCFELLIPSATDDLFSSQDFDMETEKPSVSSSESTTMDKTLRDHGIYDLKKSITIEVENKAVVQASEDNMPIIENLNDLYKEMTNRFLPKVTAWLKTLTKGSNCTDDLKKAIDLKQMIQSAFQKYKDLKIKPNIPDLDDDDEDDFIEVKDKEGYEEEVKNTKANRPISQPSSSRKPTAAEKAYMWNFKHPENDAKDPTSALSTLSKRVTTTETNDWMPSTKNLPSVQNEQTDTPKSQKEELLNKAPVRPYDIDLYHWEEEKPIIPEVVKFDSLHKFWESKNDDEENEALKEVQMASLRTRKIDFSGKFEPVKWSCRAPLPSGKLCPRKDRYKCPLHGKIVKRDETGQPVDPRDIEGPSTSNAAAVPDWQDPELLKDIEATTGINLKLPPKKGRKKGDKLKGGLTNLKIVKTTAKERLSKKILKRYKHYAHKLDEADKKKFNDKFGDQWNYY